MRPKAKWAFDSEAMRMRGIIFLVKSNQLIGQKNIKAEHFLQVKARLQSSFTTKTIQIWQALVAAQPIRMQH